MAEPIKPEQIEATFLDALQDPQDCIRLIAALEVVASILGDPDRANALEAVERLRVYVALRFPELPEQSLRH